MSANSSQLKINQVFSKHDLPTDLIITADTNRNDDNECASTSTEPSIRSGFFTVASMANGLKKNASKESVSKSIETSPASKLFVPTKVVELSSGHLVKSNVIPNSNRNSDPLPFQISSVASGEEVTLLTNGFDDDDDDHDDRDDRDDHDDDDDGNDENEMNTQPQISGVKSLATGQDVMPETEVNSIQIDSSDLTGSVLVETKTESIDISDDEQAMDIIDRESIISKEPFVFESDSHLKGYMYCSTNIQLGKVSIEWLGSGRIKLQLAESIDIDCNESEPFQKNLASVSSYMNSYIRERFYGVYPAHLRLEWIFIKTDAVDTCCTSLGDFNKVEPFSVRSITLKLLLILITCFFIASIRLCSKIKSCKSVLVIKMIQRCQ